MENAHQRCLVYLGGTVNERKWTAGMVYMGLLCQCVECAENIEVNED